VINVTRNCVPGKKSEQHRCSVVKAKILITPGESQVMAVVYQMSRKKKYLFLIPINPNNTPSLTNHYSRITNNVIPPV